jgi:general stress protein 26
MKEHDEDHIEHLNHKDSVKKMKALVGHTRTCLFTTQLSETPLQTRPMATQEVDDEGNFWFFSDEVSHKNLQIESDSRVQLFFGNDGKSEFMSVYGHAMVSHDRKKIEELWSPMVKAWFKGGKDDPTLSLILVIPDEAYYWDTKNNKMVSLVKIMSSVVSGKTMDDGVEGRLKV